MCKGYVKKYWKGVISQSFTSAWKKAEMKGAIIATCTLLIPIGIVGLLTFLNIIPIQIFTDQAKNGLSGLLTFGGALIILLILFLVMISRTPAEMNFKKEQTIRKLQQNSNEPPEIAELAKLRTEGVALRNHGASLINIDSLQPWIDKYNEWEDQVLKTLSKLSKGRSEWLRTLNRLPNYQFSNTINSEHARYLRVFEEKLKRLELIIRPYLNLPDY